MSTQDETTISQYSENDNDELLLLTGLERLEYFSEKQMLKPKRFKDHFFMLCKKLNF